MPFVIGEYRANSAFRNSGVVGWGGILVVCGDPPLLYGDAPRCMEPRYE